MSNSRLDDLLDLNEVPRWNSRVRLLRRQTVAEHTFNVMAIASEIVIKLDAGATFGIKHRLMCRVLQWALVHDGPESETGDINFLFKRQMDRAAITELEVAACPWYKDELEDTPSGAGQAGQARVIVKIADKIEEFLFITKWTRQKEGWLWLPGIVKQIRHHVKAANAAHGYRNLTKIVGGIIGPDVLGTDADLEGEVNPDVGNLNDGAVPDAVDKPNT